MRLVAESGFKYLEVWIMKGLLVSIAEDGCAWSVVMVVDIGEIMSWLGRSKGSDRRCCSYTLASCTRLSAERGLGSSHIEDDRISIEGRFWLPK